MGMFSPLRQGSGRCIYLRSSRYGTLRKPYFLVMAITIPLVIGLICPTNGPRWDEISIPQSGDKIGKIC